MKISEIRENLTFADMLGVCSNRIDNGGGSGIMKAVKKEMWVFRMMKLTSKETFNTSMGTVFIINSGFDLKVGDDIIINDVKYKIKKIMEHSRLSDSNSIAIFV
ncbi:MAG: hypothetical protein ACI4KH_00655 [Oscillospiraceae bacterium]